MNIFVYTLFIEIKKTLFLKYFKFGLKIRVKFNFTVEDTVQYAPFMPLGEQVEVHAFPVQVH
jgi:hypothetical protein